MFTHDFPPTFLAAQTRIAAVNPQTYGPPAMRSMARSRGCRRIWRTAWLAAGLGDTDT